ncbi:Protein SOGA1 [Bagarius yarrelli]|uniref:Protein SOGA1 n=1 Tax=Bagarius yarrelli TaxID=175774 RepID=A0A556V192_BAGYA|nr:Protein SOGA1 [Bagarius yarrelli]
MTKTKIQASSLVYALTSDAVKSEAHKMNQIKPKDTQSKPKRDTSSSQKEVKRNEKTRRSAPGSVKSRNKPSGRRTISGDALSKDSGGKTDSSSETSESTSEENRADNNHVQTNELDNGGADVEKKERYGGEVVEMMECNFPSGSLTPSLGIAVKSISPFTSMDDRWKLSASGALEFTRDEAHNDLLKEIDDVRSENEYLKDELEELRSEMLEMRDLYMEEDMYQLHGLKQQLEQANKTCRILQYRLRKAERRSLRVAQTGQVDSELICTLEHDVRVAKSVSMRLHTELESAQKKSLRLEWENEELREQVQNLEVAKQVLQAEMNKSKEDDSSDLKCQLHFAKEESALMCKKLTKMAVECETIREELSKYRLLYGDVDASQDVAGMVNSARTRETEFKVHLRLVEEEATLLSRRIVELEVENRGLKAEMNEIKEKAGWAQQEVEEIIEGSEKRLATSGCLEPEGNIKSVCVAEVENYPFGHIHNDEPLDVVINYPKDQINSEKNAEKEQDCTASLENLEAVLAVRDQAMLVRSIIQFLIPPAKNSFPPMPNKNFISSQPFHSKTKVDSYCLNNPLVLDPIMGASTSGLEMLQAQLYTLVAKIDLIINPMPSKTNQDTDANVLEKVEQGAQPSYAEKKTCPSSSNEEQNCNQLSLELLTVQIQWFLQQWRQGKRPSGEDKDLLEVSSALLSDLKAAMRDLCCELQEEYRAGQHCVQQFAEAKEAWTGVCTQLRKLQGRLEGSFETKESEDLEMESQKDYFGKLENLLDESYAAVTDVARQLKMYEHNWTCNSQGLLTCLSEVNLDWDRQSKDTEFQTFRSLQKKEESKRLTNQVVRLTPKPHKNWIYLSQDAALVDREDPWKTWDCPIMPPSFPCLNLKQTTANKSHTAPEKTSIRVYYSPPSARRVVLSSVPFEDEDRCEKKQKKAEPYCHQFKRINKTNVCDTCQDMLTFPCQSTIKQGPFALISNSSSDLKSPDVLYSSCLPLGGWEVSGNLSDDMKEITASVVEKRSRSNSDRLSVKVISIGTQTHTQTQVKSVGLQTDNYQSVCARHQLARSPLFVQSQDISSPLEWIAEPLEKLPLCSTSSKQQQRHSASSPISSNSSSTSITNSSYTFNSVSLSSSASSLASSSRLEPTKQYSVYGLSQCNSSNAKPSSAFGVSTEKSSGCKTSGIHKYGLVQEFFRNVCGRGEKPTPPNSGEKKILGIRRDPASSARVKKKEGPPSRIPTVPLSRSDSVTKINHRFMKQGRKDEPRPSQTQTQGQCPNQARTPMNKGKSFGPANLEINITMSCTLEKVLSDARTLLERLKEHDTAAECLIEQSSVLNQRIHCMKEVGNALPDKLWLSLEEHQYALELIMGRYRKQMLQLMMEKKELDTKPMISLHEDHAKEVQGQLERICEMGQVMRRAVQVDEKHYCSVKERLAQLEIENKELHDLLAISKNMLKPQREETTHPDPELKPKVTDEQ